MTCSSRERVSPPPKRAGMGALLDTDIRGPFPARPALNELIHAIDGLVVAPCQLAGEVGALLDHVAVTEPREGVGAAEGALERASVPGPDHCGEIGPARLVLPPARRPPRLAHTEGAVTHAHEPLPGGAGQRGQLAPARRRRRRA